MADSLSGCLVVQPTADRSEEPTIAAQLVAVAAVTVCSVEVSEVVQPDMARTQKTLANIRFILLPFSYLVPLPAVP